MVNGHGISYKSQILTILRDSSASISGDILGSHIGISRVAIHKNIQSLKNELEELRTKTLSKLR